MARPMGTVRWFDPSSCDTSGCAARIACLRSPFHRTNSSVLTTFPIFGAICMRNHRILHCNRKCGHRRVLPESPACAPHATAPHTHPWPRPCPAALSGRRHRRQYEAQPGSSLRWRSARCGRNARRRPHRHAQAWTARLRPQGGAAGRGDRNNMYNNK